MKNIFGIFKRNITSNEVKLIAYLEDEVFVRRFCNRLNCNEIFNQGYHVYFYDKIEPIKDGNLENENTKLYVQITYIKLENLYHLVRYGIKEPFEYKGKFSDEGTVDCIANGYFNLYFTVEIPYNNNLTKEELEIYLIDRGKLLFSNLEI